MRNAVDRVVPVVGISVLVLSVVLGVAALRSLPSEPDAAGVLAGSPTAPQDPSRVRLDLGATTDDDVTTCLAPSFATDVASVEVLYGERQQRLGGSSAVLVLRNAAGDLRLCDQFGADRPSQAPVATPGTEQAVSYLSSGRASFTCAGSTRVLQKLEQSVWLVVSPEVATVQQRYWVDGEPGPWFETAAQDGYVHLQTWLDGPEPAGTTFAQEYRVLDSDGAEVPQSALPTEPDPMSGCPGGGSVHID